MGIVLTVTIKPLLQTGQGVFQSDLEVLLFPPVNMHTPSLKIEEDIEFQRRLIVKQNLENSETNCERLALFGALKQIHTNIQNFSIFVGL
jgi:hypothetical protein